MVPYAAILKLTPVIFPVDLIDTMIPGMPNGYQQ
jgi:hypothetical protein